MGSDCTLDAAHRVAHCRTLTGAGDRSGGEASPPALLQQQLHPSHRRAPARPAGGPAGVAVDSPGVASLGVSGAAAPETAAALLGESPHPRCTLPDRLPLVFRLSSTESVPGQLAS